jgi:hypothetical protein
MVGTLALCPPYKIYKIARKGPAMNRAFAFQLLLLLTFGMRLIAMLIGGL